ncbi:HAD-IA family hydrolase [Bowmanella denitrificans]|uniref:HAD-IA family hydrolase n=1 Tax=Bowmanella denitrificans TaxID=366582 RepID=UPI000C9D1857|nr:HAD-IA family hydrolase [Bowmanella denitrificans]
MIFYRPFQRPCALTFDLDDTLYNNKPILMRAEQALLAFLHSSYASTAGTDSKFWQTIKHQTLQEHPQLQNDMGQLRLTVLNKGLYHCGYRNQELDKAVQEAFAFFYAERSRFQVDKNICSVLARLADKLPLLAITNGNVDIQRIGIGDYFQVCLRANLSQPMKPHRAMFDLAASRLACSPNTILHVGDNLYNDVFGALQAGYQTAWFAVNRPMLLSEEPSGPLPHLHLHKLEELLVLI